MYDTTTIVRSDDDSLMYDDGTVHDLTDGTVRYKVRYGTVRLDCTVQTVRYGLQFRYGYGTVQVRYGYGQSVGQLTVDSLARNRRNTIQYGVTIQYNVTTIRRRLTIRPDGTDRTVRYGRTYDGRYGRYGPMTQPDGQTDGPDSTVSTVRYGTVR